MLDMIGDRLKKLREDAGLNGPQFAAIAGTTKQYVGRLEAGLNRDPNCNFIHAWARHFGVTMEWITSGELPREARSGSRSQLMSLSGAMILDAIQAARDTAAEMGSDDFKVEDPKDAEMIAEALYELMLGDSSTVPDSADPKFTRKSEMRNGKQPGTGKTSGVGRGTSQTKVGSKGRATGGGRK